MSLLRLSKRWFVNEFQILMLEWTTPTCETVIDSFERLTLRVPLASFRRSSIVKYLAIISKTRLCNQDPSTINDINDVRI